MPTKPRLSPTHRALISRYLTWAYKSTKESFDRLERKTTQLMADEFIWEHLRQGGKGVPQDQAYKKFIAEYRGYIDAKKEQPIDVPKHRYLKDRLAAVEAAIKKFLGQRALAGIRRRYEEEFTRRIWEAKDH